MRLSGHIASPYWKRLIGTFAIPWLFIVLFALFYYPYVQRTSRVDDATRQLETSSEMLAFSVGAGLAESNFELVQMAFNWSKKDSNVVYLGILDEKDRLIVDYDPHHRKVAHAQLLQTVGVRIVHDDLVSVAPVVVRGQRYGTIVLTYSMAAVDAAIRKQQFISIFVSLLVFAIGLRGTMLLSRQGMELYEAKAQAERQAGLLTQQAGQLHQSNEELARSNAELQQAKAALQHAHDVLELRVEERTSMLAKANKELGNTNNELNSFAYIVSHDLKAPLRAIGSLVDWLASDYRETIGSEGRQLLDLLLCRTKRMHDLIEGILQYSRVGRMREELSTVDLNDIVEEVIEGLDVPANIAIDVQPNLPTIVCERTPIRQVFQNLISNSVKFMDKELGWIRVTCDPQQDTWRFCVEDNGPGIDERHYAKIFQIFQTLNPRDEFESTGVGLTIVKKIVEMTGGRIWPESITGVGSKFFFTWPATGD